jgi:4,5-dihydroxyphthalate decarboxylase
MERLELGFAIGTNPRSLPVLNGLVKAEGIDLHCSAIHGSEIFWRQLAFQEFEVSEMSMSSLLMSRSHGNDTWVALPIFTSRKFFHTWVLVTEASGIKRPEDLAGKRVGVPEYQQTAALWTRGILQHEYGVDLKSIDWYMERPPEKSHGGATGFTPPEGIRLQYIPTTTDIGEQLATGGLDATLLYLANADNLVDRSQRVFGADSGVHLLFPDQESESSRYFQKTGIFPVNHCVAVRKDIVDRYPWAMLNLYSAFLGAKEIAQKQAIAATEPFFETGVLPLGGREAVTRDLFPYGVKANEELLHMITQFSFEQGLTHHQLGLEEIFYPPSLEL